MFSTGLERKRPTGFLDLPAEIRCNVYKELLVVGRVYYKNEWQCEYRDKRESGREKYLEPSLAILLVCKLIHGEAEQVYLKGNMFVFPSGWLKYAPFKATSHRFNKRYLFSERGFKYVRNISITVEYGEYKEDVRELPELEFVTRINPDGTETLDFATGPHNDHLIEDAQAMNKALCKFDRTPEDVSFEVVELDFHWLSCNLGCCRRLESFWWCWVQSVMPTTLWIFNHNPYEFEQIMGLLVTDTTIAFEYHGPFPYYVLEKCDIWQSNVPAIFWDAWKHEEKVRKPYKYPGKEIKGQRARDRKARRNLRLRRAECEDITHW